MATRARTGACPSPALLRAQADALEVQARTLRAQADALEAGVVESARSTSASSEPLRTTQQCAADLGISVATLNRMVRAGQVPWLPVGDSKRFDMTAVREALAARAARAKTPPVPASSLPAPSMSGVRCLSRKSASRG